MGSSSPKAASALVRRAAIGGLAVLASRLLGLVREQVFAFFFGASREYDAFLTAFRIPNLLRDLLAEGALSTAFVAVFSRALEREGKARAYAIANGIVAWAAAALCLLVAVGVALAPQLVGVMAVGFDADKAALAVSLTRLMFPFILFVALAALCMGMLNAQGYYGLPQSASTFFNVTSIVVGLLAAWIASPDYMQHLFEVGGQAATLRAAPAPQGISPPAARAMMGMAFGTLMGGLVQWAVQMPLLWRLGWRPTPRIARSDPALGEVLRLMAPAVVGAAAVQISVFFNNNFASLLGDRAISWLSYSFRLMQFPIGIFGVAVMSASLPTLSKQAGPGQERAFGETLSQALELVLFFTVPAMVALVWLGEPVVRLLFEHGRFTPEDTRACAAAVAAYAIGLPGYAALKVLQPAFVARGDAKTPMRVTVAGVALAQGLNAVLLFGLSVGHVGLALSTSALASGSSLALIVLLERRQPTLERQSLAGQAGRIALASSAVALVLAMGVRVAATASGPLQTPRAAALELVLLGALGGGVYVAAGRALGVRTLARAASLLGRRLRGRRV